MPFDSSQRLQVVFTCVEKTPARSSVECFNIELHVANLEQFDWF